MAINRRRRAMPPPLDLPPQGNSGGRRRNIAINESVFSAGLTEAQVENLYDFLDLEYNEKIHYLSQVAQASGFDRGWAARNLSNFEGIVRKLPLGRHVTTDMIEVFASHLQPPEHL